MDTTHDNTWPSEAQMPVGHGLPDSPLQLWEADGWSHASLVIAPPEAEANGSARPTSGRQG